MGAGVVRVDDRVAVLVRGRAAAGGYAALGRTQILVVLDVVAVAVAVRAAVRVGTRLVGAPVVGVRDAIRVGVDHGRGGCGPGLDAEAQLKAEQRLGAVRGAGAGHDRRPDDVADIDPHRQAFGGVDLEAAAEVERRLDVIASDRGAAGHADGPAAERKERHDPPPAGLQHRLGASGVQERAVGPEAGGEQRKLAFEAEEAARVVAKPEPDLRRDFGVFSVGRGGIADPEPARGRQQAAEHPEAELMGPRLVTEDPAVGRRLGSCGRGGDRDGGRGGRDMGGRGDPGRRRGDGNDACDGLDEHGRSPRRSGR